MFHPDTLLPGIFHFFNPELVHPCCVQMSLLERYNAARRGAPRGIISIFFEGGVGQESICNLVTLHCLFNKFDFFGDGGSVHKI